MSNMRRATGALVGFVAIATTVALVSATMHLASAADLSIAPNKLAFARTTATPYVAVEGVFDAADSPKLNDIALNLDPGTGDFADQNPPSWRAAGSLISRWTIDSTNDTAAKTNPNSTASFARFPWMSSSSYIQASYLIIDPDITSFFGVCLLCSNQSTSPGGMVARMEVRVSDLERRYWITLGIMEDGTFDQTDEIKVTTNDTAPVNKILKMSYNASTGDMTVTFDGGNTLTRTVPVGLRSNTYAGLIAWRGSTTRMYNVDAVDARKPVA